MPSITIKEIDNTSPGVVLSAQDVVFVPGFVNIESLVETAAPAYVPTLCSTVAEFESYFGAIPAQFKQNPEGENYPTGFSTASISGLTKMFEVNTMDPGYIYAKELINAGLPVLYVRCNETAEEVTVEHMYKVLASMVNDYDVWSDIKDIGEFPEIKFITSGGYPTFEFDVLKLIPKYTNVTITEGGFEQSVFVKKVPRKKDEKRTAQFRYARLVKVVDVLPDAPAAGEEGLIFVVESTDEAFEWKLDTETSKYSWVSVAPARFKIWEASIDEEEFSQVDIAQYGFNIESVTYGGLIYVEVPAESSATSFIADKMIDVANSRGDAVALVDHTDNASRTLNPTSKNSVYYAAANVNSSYVLGNGEFAAMFTPWCTCPLVTDLYNVLNNGSDITRPKAITPDYMPASFVYLKAYAESVQTNASWLAVAGAARGVANIGKPHLATGVRLSNSIADSYQPRYASGEFLGIAVNPITNIKPYGYLIWGNRTLKKNPENLTATSFLNTRNMVSDIKKLAYRSAKTCMFEQNSDILWANFKSKLTPTLDQMVSGSGLSGYKIIKKTTTEKAKLVCVIRLYPIYAVETFDITVELADDEITIS